MCFRRKRAKMKAFSNPSMAKFQRNLRSFSLMRHKKLVSTLRLTKKKSMKMSKQCSNKKAKLRKLMKMTSK